MPYKKNLEFTPLMMLLRLSFILLLLVLFTPAQAEEPASGFDHFSTGFPLIGRHEVIDCSECHIAGQFKGTPLVCGLCHNNIRAPGKHPQHVPSSNICDDCHTERTWLGAKYDHIGIQNACETCHNNSIAIGMSASHIHISSSRCEDCHNTITFDRVARVDHTFVIGTCSSCHDGIIATGKDAGHLVTTDDCGNCHTTTGWLPATDD